jgi:hypothetical protein
MFSRTTRLEFAIVAAVLLIMVLYSRPPTSGNADTLAPRIDLVEETQFVEPELPPATVTSAAAPAPETHVAAPPDSGSGATKTQRRGRRVGVVDATGCQDLDYKDVMYGEVAVRWVWNGEKLVPQKVCIVEEGNGVRSVWGFDANDEIVLSEYPQGPAAHPKPRP